MSYLHYLYFLSHSGVHHILCCVFVLFVFVLCSLCGQFLWIVPFWLPLQYIYDDHICQYAKNYEITTFILPRKGFILLVIANFLSLLRFIECSFSYTLTYAYHRSRSWLCQSNDLGEYPGMGQFYLCTPPWHLRIYRNIVCFWTIHCNKNSQIPSINKTIASFIWNTEVIWYILRNICLVSSNIIIQTWNALLEKHPGVTSGTLKVKRLKNILE